MEELIRLHNALQNLYAVLHHAIRNVRAKHQAKVPRVVYLTEHPELPLVTLGIPVPSFRPVTETNDLRVTLPTKWYTAEVVVPIDDDNIEG